MATPYPYSLVNIFKQLAHNDWTKLYRNTEVTVGGQENSDGIATRYGLDGLVIEFRWVARFSAPNQTDPGAHPGSCAMNTGPFQGVKRPGRGTDPTPIAEVLNWVEPYLYPP